MLNNSSQDVIAESPPLFGAGMPWRIRLGAIQWLILSAAVIVIAITLGTGYFAMQYRERALEVAERELNNSALLLSRHFDQQLLDLQHVQEDVVTSLRADGVHTADDFESKMSTLSAHEMLRTKLSVMPHVGALNLWSAKGWLINSSEMWPVADKTVTDRRYFQEFMSGKPTPDVIVEPVVSKVTKIWTTIFARKIIGRKGEIIGFAVRGVEPSHFEDFVASLALDSDTAISMIHRDGTIIARYPKDDALIGQNVAEYGRVSARAGAGRQYFGTLHQREIVGRQGRRGQVADALSDPHRRDHQDGDRTADWRAQTRLQFFAAALAVVVVIGMVFLIVRQLRSQHAAAQRKLSEKSQHLDTAINNMTQGLLLFDSSGRLVICNRQYIDMFGLSTDVVKPGCHLRDLIRHRQELGSFVGDVDAYCARFLDPNGSLVQDTVTSTPDGRTIRLIYKRSPDGGWATTLEDVTEGRRDQARIEHLAHYDALTNLPNRTLFQRHAEELLLEAEGRAVRDPLYRHRRVQAHQRYAGTSDRRRVPQGRGGAVAPVGRVRRISSPASAGMNSPSSSTASGAPRTFTALVARIYQALRTPFDCHGHQLSSDASIGIAIAPRDGTDLFDLLKNADLAMYAAKAAGRRTYRFFDPEMEQQANHRRELEADLRAALAQGAFELHYQPQVDLRSDGVTGCEALLRWRHPVRGMVSPADFVPVAEETGLIEEIGQWVLRTACAEAATWPADVRIAVNVSPIQFRSETLSLKVAAVLAETGLDPRRLELEITEAVLIADDDAALATLNQLRALGVHIALDDFGTGYSSLQYLQRFPFDKIKIDRSFVKEVTRNSSSASIIRAVVSIAADRNMITTAEGVETLQQRETVQNLGCTQMQGFLFSAARPAQEIRALLASGEGGVEDAA